MIDLCSNTDTNVSFVSDTPQGYSSVGADMLKDSSLMGTFPLPLLDTSSAPINMISSITSRYLTSPKPWVVPRPLTIEPMEK